jgi:hypothetical protein
MPKNLWSAELPLVCQRRFEPSRVQEQLWSAAYEQLVPQGRRPLGGADSAVPCRGKQASGVPLISDSVEEKCA